MPPGGFGRVKLQPETGLIQVYNLLASAAAGGGGTAGGSVALMLFALLRLGGALHGGIGSVGLRENGSAREEREAQGGGHEFLHY